MAFLPSPQSISVFCSQKRATTCSYRMPMRLTPSMKSKGRKPRSGIDKTAEAPAPRVDVNSSTLSLRQQLRIAKASTEIETLSKPVTRTKFRKKKDPAARPSKPEQANTPDGKYSLEKPPIIYIDGYNVIGMWPRLRKWREKNDMSTARQLLINDVTEFSHVRGWDCVCVFDAHGTSEHAKVEQTPENVTVVFTGSETADSYIERNVFEMCRIGERQIWAATSDTAQSNFSQSTGAHVMSSKLFVQEMKRARRETRERINAHDEGSIKGKMLISTVDQTTRDRLYELRDFLNAG